MTLYILNPRLSAREILILVHALKIATESGELLEIARKQELAVLRDKLSNVK